MSTALANASSRCSCSDGGAGGGPAPTLMLAPLYSMCTCDAELVAAPLPPPAGPLPTAGGAAQMTGYCECG